MTLDEIELLIKETKTAKDLFGADPEDRHKQLQYDTHPDRTFKSSNCW